MYVYGYNLNSWLDLDIIRKFVKNFDEVIEHMKENSYESSEIMEFYNNIIKLFLNEKNENLFYEVKKAFKNNFEKFSRPNKHTIYGILQNAAVRLRTVDNEKFYREGLELYKEMIQLNLYNSSVNGEFYTKTFYNIINCALNFKEYEWIEKFTKDYIGKVVPEHRDSIYNFTYANLHFGHKDFDKALEHLNKVKPDTFGYKYDAKMLLLKNLL